MKDAWRASISSGRKKYLAENPDKHPWKKSTKFQSEPCEYLKSELRKRGIDFVEEFCPLKERAFSIDIALPKARVGIEVNGNQHYERNGTLKPYYLERQQLIEAQGWQLIELHYAAVFNNDVIDALVLGLFDGDIACSNAEIQEFQRLSFENKNFKTLEKEKAKLQKTELQQQARIKRLSLLAEIDVTKFGWVQKASMIWEMEPQCVSRWVKKHFPDFYRGCYKRKMPP